jgi:hypothetical protein
MGWAFADSEPARPLLETLIVDGYPHHLASAAVLSDPRVFPVLKHIKISARNAISLHYEDADTNHDHEYCWDELVSVQFLDATGRGTHVCDEECRGFEDGHMERTPGLFDFNRAVQSLITNATIDTTPKLKRVQLPSFIDQQRWCHRFALEEEIRNEFKAPSELRSAMDEQECCRSYRQRCMTSNIAEVRRMFAERNVEVLAPDYADPTWLRSCDICKHSPEGTSRDVGNTAVGEIHSDVDDGSWGQQERCLKIKRRRFVLGSGEEAYQSLLEDACTVAIVAGR